MQITLELYASLMPMLPPGSTMHAAEIVVDGETTPNQVIDRYRIPHELAHLVLINGFFVCGDERDTPVFKEGDKIAIWPPVAGG